MNTVGDGDDAVVLLLVPAMADTINCCWVGDGSDELTTVALRCTMVVACGTDTVRKTAPPELVVIAVAVVLPFNLDLLRAAAVEGCTSVTLMGVTLGFAPEERCCCMAFRAPLLLLSRLVPACMTGVVELAAGMLAVDVLLLLTACECLYRDVFAGRGAGSVKAYGSSWTRDAC